MGELILILVSTCLVNNLVLDFMLGTDPIIAVSKQPSPAFHLCMLVIITMPVTSVFLYLINNNILIPFELVHLQLIITVMLVSVSILLSGNLVRSYKPALHRQIAPFIPLIIVDCTILGFALLAGTYQLGLAGTIFYGLGSALGFSLILMTIASIREKVSVSDVPIPFRGVAILMITLGLISMAFMGFDGISTTK